MYGLWRFCFDMTQKEFYHTKAWARCRAAYAASKDGLCERCLANGRYVPGKVVHHRTWLNDETVNDPAVSLNFSNLELVCQDCHNAEHHSATVKRFRFNDAGDLIITG